MSVFRRGLGDYPVNIDGAFSITQQITKAIAALILYGPGHKAPSLQYIPSEKMALRPPIFSLLGGIRRIGIHCVL